MSKKPSHFLLELIDIVKQELLAVLAVAGVLTFVFNQATANQFVAANPEDEMATAAVSEVITADVSGAESSGADLFAGGPTIYFGSQIQGMNSNIETWTNSEAVANLGYAIITAAPTQVTITGVSNGTFTIYATASGTFYANGTKFDMGDKQSISRETVTITQNKLVIKFEPETKIWKLSTLAGNVGIADNDRTPTIVSVLPEMRTLRVGSILQPVLIVQDQDGKIMPAPSEIDWSSSDETIATVNSNGKITALKPGVVTITATIAGADITASLSINVPPNSKAEMPPTIRINTEAPESTVDQLVSEITQENASGNSTTEKPLIGMETSLFEYFTGQKTSAATLNATLGTGLPNSQTNPTTIAEMPIVQIMNAFFEKVLSSLSAIALYLKR